jgi:hypothetical protein
MLDERRFPHLTRRGFLMGATGVGLGALVAGCGGGGDNGDGFDDIFEGTYRYFRDNVDGRGGDVAASFTVDDFGLVTFWTLYASDSPLLDFGQVFIDNGGFFEQQFDGVRTRGRLRGNNRIEGRTELIGSGNGFDFNATFTNRFVSNPPPAFLTGTYNGFQRLRGIDIFTLLGVSRDGNATVFVSLDNPATGDTDYFIFEGPAFNRDGNAEGYFLDLYGDRMAIRDDGSDDDVRMEFQFGRSAPDVGFAAGEVIELRLDLDADTRTRSLSLPARANVSRTGPGVRRAVEALRARKGQISR